MHKSEKLNELQGTNKEIEKSFGSLLQKRNREMKNELFIGLLAAVCFWMVIYIMYSRIRGKVIKHSSHEHPLKLFGKKINDDNIFCKGCEKALSGRSKIYGCTRCKFYLHKFCAELQQEIDSFFHPCTLILRRSHFRCNGCDKSKSSFSYHCGWCDFNLDVDCALQSTIISENEEQIQHFSHWHPLTLIARTEGVQICCSVCEEFCRGLTYGCGGCNFFLHKSCMDNLPRKIQHIFHQCILILLRISSFQCECCGETRSGLAFSCGKCKFHLDIQCALLPTTISDPQKQIKNFLHRHPLTICERGDGDEVCCKACGENCLGSSYSCRRCNFNLHKSCAQLPQILQHSFHPCLLVLYKSTSYKCNGCYENRSGLVFCCRKCKFYLDVECTLLPTIKSDDHKKIQHFSHGHPLIACEKQDVDNIFCETCGESCFGQAYGCNTCNYYLHKSCAELPQEVQHFFHPCPLILRKTSSYECEGCDGNGSGLAFCCEKCDFDLDVECALLPTIDSEGHKKIQHFSHGHPLTICKKNVGDDVCCKGCGERCLGLTYNCSKCNYCLHKSCANLEREVRHPFHPQHPLTLLVKTFDCNVCYMNFRGFSYNCANCNFDMHIECASWIPSVKYEPHEHLLTFLKQMYGKPTCRACNSSFPTTSYLRCVECDFNVHLLCAPLPQTIKHFCHIDPLTLKDCHIEHLDDSGEYYCDACEDERDPRECVYYCEECDFIAHVRCVISEVLPILKGERGDVELRRVDRNIALNKLDRKGLILNDIFESLTDDDKMEFDRFKSAFEKDLDGLEDKIHKSRRENIDEIMKYHSYSDVDFIMFTVTMEFALPEDFLNFLSLAFVNYESEIVNIGKYKVTQDLAPVLRDLLIKYGDFAAESHLNSNMKTYCLVIFAGVIHSMCNTKVMEVTGELLMQWWLCCKLAQYVGFKVQFAFECLNKVAYARFAVEYSELHAGTTLCEIQEEITQLSRETEELIKKLEALKVKRKQHISSTRSASSSLSVESLTDALELRLKTARFVVM